MAESTENCMKTGDCFAEFTLSEANVLAMTFETCDLLKLTTFNKINGITSVNPFCLWGYFLFKVLCS